jgi:hypothetical protein
MSVQHLQSVFIYLFSNNQMLLSILSHVGCLRQGRRTLRACNLVADVFSKSHGSDVPPVTERYRNPQLENTHVVQIQLPDQIEFRNQPLKCVCVCLCFLSRFKVPLHLLLLASRNGRSCRYQKDCQGRGQRWRLSVNLLAYVSCVSDTLRFVKDPFKEDLQYRGGLHVLRYFLLFVVNGPYACPSI